MMTTEVLRELLSTEGNELYLRRASFFAAPHEKLNYLEAATGTQTDTRVASTTPRGVRQGGVSRVASG